MITDKLISPRRLIVWTGHHLIWLTVWAITAVCVCQFTGLSERFAVPWLPISLIGTALAFYAGFKNNSAYDRMWEARKVWGAIVNSSREWGSMTKGFVTDQFSDENVSEDDVHQIHKRLIYRHIAWLYALRSQLLVVKEWEHAAQEGLVGANARQYQREFGIGMIDDEITREELHLFMPETEYEELITFQNTATQIIDRQSTDLKELRRRGLIDDFRHVEMQKVLGHLYSHQGKCERIKNFPLPRQYANIGSIFVFIFIALLPFGLMFEFSKHGESGAWWSIPFVVLVGWVFCMMEAVGDHSENPFQGMLSDIPMFSLCRAIEIDLREMLGETNLPPKIQSKNGILM